MPSEKRQLFLYIAVLIYHGCGHTEAGAISVVSFLLAVPN